VRRENLFAALRERGENYADFPYGGNKFAPRSPRPTQLN